MKIEKEIIKQPFWAMSAEDAMLALKSSQFGISESDVKDRKNIFGPNKIINQKRFVQTKIFLRQFKSPLIYLLVLAALVTIYLGELNEATFIFIAVAVNVVLGFYQESKAEKALESLAGYLETKTRVMRGGKLFEINIEDLVPGDIIHFSSGDSIPADCRIISANNLLVDESILTGESLPVEKGTKASPLSAVLADRRSMLFSGTLAVEGLGTAIVVATAKNTELGNIAALINEITEEKTPLQKTIDSFAKKLALLVTVLAISIFFMGILYEYSPADMFKMSIAVAVAAVPEGLIIALTVILAVGVERLAKRKGVVRRLLSAETLGDTSVILTDKTGTLTEAKLNLVGIDSPKIEDNHSEEERKKEIIKFAILSTDARVTNPDDPAEDWKFVGKALDVALIKGALNNFDIKESDLRQQYTILDRLPFNSQNKFSSVKVKKDGMESILLIGAPEVVLKLCHTFYWNGQRPISEIERAELLKDVHKKAYEGHRIISVASSSRQMNLADAKKIDGFAYLGNILLKDTVRKDAGAVIGEIGQEGIRTVIVTGDHAGTAIAIARELGMSIDKNAVIEQHELDLMDNEQLVSRLPEIKIFARVNPESKVRIAKLFQAAGHVVAMTGDGVNDAPALKQADVGIAIGSGSGVARESADLVLLDDSFGTIVAAIDEGRRILQNIRKVLVFSLANLFDAIILVGGSIFLNIPIPVNAVQILWVNFVTDSFPIISISYEDEIGKGERIRKKISRSSVFDKEVKFLIWVIGVLTSILLFAAHYFLLKAGFPEQLSRTFVFSSLGVYTLLLTFSVKSLDKNIWNYNPFNNKVMNLSAFVGLALMMVAIYSTTLQKLLGTVSLPGVWLAGVFLMGFTCMAMVEFGKYLFISRK
jgi:Ca2+-transporting ATPase